jgi:sphingomyelin phosphodiesterase
MNFGHEGWLTDWLAEEWGKFLPADALKTIAATGAYSTLHKGTNLRIVVVNTIACYTDNLYLLSNITDPGD